MDYESTLKNKVSEIELAIDKYLPPASTRPTQLHEAMLYSMKAGGKRLRPLLLLAAFDLNPSEIDPMPAASAMECLHNYTLVHDDLPSIDNSDFRRNQPSCHKKFDEATAITAGDALLTHAFYLLAKEYRFYPEIANLLIYQLSQAGGSERLIGGQMEDILGEKLGIDEKRLEYIHLNKTAALISTSIVMGLTINRSSNDVVEKAAKAGTLLGLAFQIIDDILDVEGDPSLLGKPQGIDMKNKKITYPSIIGLKNSREKALNLTQEALSLLSEIAPADSFLYALCTSLINRKF